MTLLEKAQKEARAVKRQADDELVDLAVAWATGVVTDNQAAKALGYESVANIAPKMARALRLASDDGRVRIERLRR